MSAVSAVGAVNATEDFLGKNHDNESSTALDSVRRLEETLDDRRGVEEAAAARVAAAREEAGKIVRDAREGAERDAAEHRRATLERADGEAGRVLEKVRAEAASLRALAGEDRPVAAREVVDFVLPGSVPGTGA